MVPTFRYMGGKARMRKWLLDHFPESGRYYIEPFAGVGNVYFLSQQQLQFQHWLLNDINPFLSKLAQLDTKTLPDSVDRELFKLLSKSESDLAVVLEPRVSFAGKGYKAGYGGSFGTHVGYSGKCYRPLCETAQQLLTKATITHTDWQQLNLTQFGQDDFVYFDPPYLGTKASYPDIDHSVLVEVCNTAKFQWALSGYRNPLYDTQLQFSCRFERERNSEIKGLNTGKYEAVVETLWTNYEL